MSATIKAILFGLLIAAIVGLGYGYGEMRYDAGVTTERAAWTARENTELAQANAQIQKLEEDARTVERQHVEDLAEISANYQQELQDANDQKDRALADLRSGALQLRDPDAAAGQGTAVCPSTATAAGTGGRDGAAQGHLSAAASEFLLGLASDADQVAQQLTACQAIIASDRRQAAQQAEPVAPEK